MFTDIATLTKKKITCVYQLFIIIKQKSKNL